MAENKKITELTALTEAASDDVLPIVDISASETKKITYDNLLKECLKTSGGTITGNLTVQGNTTLGDASSDTLTFNASTLSIPNNLNIDSGTLYIDAANNRVGIGTTDPKSILSLGDGTDVVRISLNGTLGSYDTLDFYEVGTLRWRLGNASASNYFALYDEVNDAWRVVVDESNGNVGIGTTSPSEKLEVYDGAIKIKRSLGSQLIFDTIGANIGSYTLFYVDGAKRWVCGRAYSNDDYFIERWTGAAGSEVNQGMVFRIKSANGDVILGESAGNVGIGTTDPQEKLHISGGVATYDPDRSITDLHHIVDKKYVDEAVTALGARYYMLDTDSGTEDYKNTSLTASTGAEQSISKSDLSDDDYIAGWIAPNPNEPDKLIAGVYNWRIYAEKTGGTKTLRLYWKLVERKSDNSEVVIGTSVVSNEIVEGKNSYIIPLTLSADHEIASDSYVVGKIYADVSGSGSDPSVTLYYEGDSDSHWEIPVNLEILNDRYVQKSGDTISGNLTVSGTLTIDSLNGILKASSGAVSGDAELNDLADVNAPSPSDGDVLTWDAGTSKWIASAGGGGGDMLKSVYDTDDDGVVDDAEKLEGNTLAQVRDHSPKAHASSHANGGSDEINTPLNIGAIPDNVRYASITFVIDGGGSAITTGQKGHLRIPFSCEIQSVTLLADQTGSIQVDIWKDTYANFPPTDSDSITGGNEPAISSAQKYEDTTLSGWTKTINAGDVLAFNVDSCSTITRVVVALKVKKT